jgi:hypothetical protein
MEDDLLSRGEVGGVCVGGTDVAIGARTRNHTVLDVILLPGTHVVLSAVAHCNNSGPAITAHGLVNNRGGYMQLEV